MAITFRPGIRAFFDEPTNTVSYLVWDPATKEGAVIDPVLNFDHRTGEATVQSADAILAQANKLRTPMPTICRARPISNSRPARG
jgi:glyoxylase-like metal-dependent hydrolase (beta-lactamase superfamily II)